MCRKACGRTVDNDLFLLDRTRRLRIGAEALHRAAFSHLILRIAGVENAQMPVLLRAAARVAAILIVLIRRPERELRNLIGTEIARLRMRPRLIFVRAAVGIPLVENMIRTVVVRHAVRVVDESERHLDMKAIVPTMREGEALREFCINRPLVKILHVAHSSGRKKVKVRPNATPKPTALTRMYSGRWSR